MRTRIRLLLLLSLLPFLALATAYFRWGLPSSDVLKDLGNISQIGLVLLGIVAVGGAIQQLNTEDSSLNLSRAANKAAVIAHCADRFAAIMRDLSGAIDASKPQKFRLRRKPAEEEEMPGDERIWWYRLWDMYSEEYLLFRRNMLDADIFEFWMCQLARDYPKNPRNQKTSKTMRESHQYYLDRVVHPRHTIDSFFRKLLCLAECHRGSKEDLFDAVRVHVYEYQKMPDPREERVREARERLEHRNRS